MFSYTPAQLVQYLTHISFPPTNGPYTPDNLPAPTLATLRQLVVHHLATVPFESISLHYSTTRRLDLDPEALFRKIVRLPSTQDPSAAPSGDASHGTAEVGGLLGAGEWADGGGDWRGGYCMEVDAFLAAVLRGLGYDVVTCGGRVSYVTQGQSREGFSGWNHMVNLVTLDGNRYLVDVGFGASTPHYPIPIPSFLPSSPTPPVAPNDLRKITLERLPNSHPSAPKLYIYSHRPSPSAPWTAGYAFTDVEFFPDDFAVMNLSTMTRSFFTDSVLSVRHFLEDSEDAKARVLAGQVVLHGTEVKVRRRVRNAGADDIFSAGRVGAQGPNEEEYGPYETLETFSTEDGRIAALRKWFGIVVSDEDRKGIVGLASELKG